MGHSDILDHPHGDGKDGLCVTSFFGEQPRELSKIRSIEKHFSNVVILRRVPLVALNSLTFWGMVLLEYLVVLIIRHSII